MLKEEAIRKHRAMWNYIADEIENTHHTISIENMKGNYVERVGDANMYMRRYSNCYLCYYTKFKCKNCPIKWPSDAHVRMCENGFMNEHDMSTAGLYKQCRKLADSGEWEKQAKLAREIANLPEQED